MRARFSHVLVLLCSVLLVSPAIMAETISSEVVSTTVTAPEASEAVTFSPARPGFGDGTATMAPWYLGFEFGLGLSAASDAVCLEQALLVRMGITSWLEARVQVPGVLVSQHGGSSGTDGGLGTKIGFDLFDGLGVALVTMLAIPVTDEGAGSFGLSNGLNVGLTLSDTVSVALTGVADITLPDEGELTWELGGALGLVGSLGDDASVFLEGILVSDQSGATTPGFALGATRMLTDTMQFDLFFQYDAFEAGTAVLVGTGLSFML